MFSLRRAKAQRAEEVALERRLQKEAAERDLAAARAALAAELARADGEAMGDAPPAPPAADAPVVAAVPAAAAAAPADAAAAAGAAALAAAEEEEVGGLDPSDVLLEEAAAAVGTAAGTDGDAPAAEHQPPVAAASTSGGPVEGEKPAPASSDAVRAAGLPTASGTKEHAPAAPAAPVPRYHHRNSSGERQLPPSGLRSALRQLGVLLERSLGRPRPNAIHLNGAPACRFLPSASNSSGPSCSILES